MSPEVQAAMEDWLNKWDRMPGPLKAKDERLQAYLNYLKYTFNLYFLNPLSPLSRTSEDAAMAPGGIKLDNILMERQGSLMADVLSDQAQENMLAQASGLYGVIVGITPISNLPDFIQ